MIRVFAANGLPLAFGVPSKYALKSRTIKTSGSTYTVPAGIRALLVECQGGGGAGGGAATAAASGAAASGGAGGGYSAVFLTARKASYGVNIGAGGTGGASAGSNGDATTFDTTLITCRGGGGLGGTTGGTAGSTSLIRLGTTGASVDTGDVKSQGGVAGFGFRYNATILGSGNGGDSHFGAGGAGRTTQGDGNAGGLYGGGGGGAVVVNGGAATNGGNGAQGVMIVWEFA